MFGGELEPAGKHTAARDKPLKPQRSGVMMLFTQTQKKAGGLLNTPPVNGKWTKRHFVDVDNVPRSIFPITLFPIIANRETKKVRGAREERLIIMCLRSVSSAGSDMSIPVTAPRAAHHLYIPRVGLFRNPV